MGAERFEAVIGLEVHAQLNTATKIFCGCPTTFGAEPNSQTCPVCAGLPGALPVMNRRVLEWTIRTGLAMNCRIAEESIFARKNYFYPDLPKGYQISQYERPICEGGYVEIVVDGRVRRVGITRIHMEEDAGKSIHDESAPFSLVDLNRSCVPLMEIVSEPDIRSAAEAAAYMRKLRTIVRYLDVCDGNMEQGSLRCDANVSVRLKGDEAFGTRTELKNINSFRFVEKAVDYEIARQIRVIEEGGRVVQETRLWDTAANRTVPMRGKEEAHDYRYFPDPDLVPLRVDAAWVDAIRSAMVELPDSRRERFVSQYDLPEAAAEMLTGEKGMADWFEAGVKAGARPKAAANWVSGELLRRLNETDTAIEDCPVRPEQLAALLTLVDKGTVSGSAAKKVFEDMMRTGGEPEAIVKARGLVQISDSSELETAVRTVLEDHPDEVERFRGGEGKLMGFFVGQVMKATRGKANPKLVNELVRKLTAV